MQVKYTVYYKDNNHIPRVAIWKTTGDLIHSVYERKHHILPQNVSSRGYIYFNPLLNRWSLEHYQMDEGTPARTLGELIQQKRIEKRDRLLVKRKIHQTDFLNDSYLKKETWRDKKSMTVFLLRNLLTLQYD